MNHYEKLKKSINNINPRVKLTQENDCIRLEGEDESWENIVLCGQKAAEIKKYRGVINNIKLINFTEKEMSISSIKDEKYNNKKVDVLVVGGGIVGAAILRELTKFELKLLLIEKEDDVGTAQSARNDGMVHAGIDLKNTSLKWKYNMRGNKLYDKLTEELQEPFTRCGQYVLFTEKWQRLTTPFIKKRAKKNQVPVKFYTKEELEKLEPHAKNHFGGFFCENAGIVSPFGITVALAENAVLNGAEIALNTALIGIELKDNKIVCVTTNRGKIYPSVVINASGVYSDKIAEMAGDRFYTIHPRKGVDIIFDKKAKHITNAVLGKFSVKGSQSKNHTKGGGLVSTVHHNLLAGPNAKETPHREDNSTEASDIDEVMGKQTGMVNGLGRADIITAFGGVRAATYEEDFIVERSKRTTNFIQAAGIQSPGVTAAPAIAEDVAKLTIEALGKMVKAKADFNPIRKRIPEISALSIKERDEFIKLNPDYGVIVCRCEEVSKGEIIDAIHNPLGVCSIDGIKRRVRAGMGRCQGGFCMPIITKIIAKEKNIPIEQVTKKGDVTNIILTKTK